MSNNRSVSVPKYLWWEWILLHPRYKIHISFLSPNQIFYVPNSHPTILAEYSILIIIATAASPQGHVKSCWSNSVQLGKSSLAFRPPCYHECAPYPSWYGPRQANRSALHWAQGVNCYGSSFPCQERLRSLPLNDPEKPRPHLNLEEAFKNLLSPDYMALLPFPLQDNQLNFPQRSKAGGDLLLSLRIVVSCPATQWPREARDLEGPSTLWGLGQRWQRKNTHYFFSATSICNICNIFFEHHMNFPNQW